MMIDTRVVGVVVVLVVVLVVLAGGLVVVTGATVVLGGACIAAPHPQRMSDGAPSGMPAVSVLASR